MKVRAFVPHGGRVGSLHEPLLAALVRSWRLPDSGATEQWLRRVLDVAVSLVALLAAAPVMLAIAAAIRLDSPGPALFWQVRMTRDRRGAERRQRDASRSQRDRRGGGDRRQCRLPGRPFRFVKFRTMVVDARKRFPELYRYEYSPEEIRVFKFKLENDPRLTRVGRWLRKTTLDELPNFWNVLRGDMTLVGPRPEIPEMGRYYDGAQRRKFSVPSGVTGAAQTSGRGLLTFQQTAAYDLGYVDHRSIWLDLKLLVRTVLVTVKRTGAF